MGKKRKPIRKVVKYAPKLVLESAVSLGHYGVLAFEITTNPLPLLVTSFFFLFLMFVLFTWNRRENRYLVIRSWSVYALLFYYWILAR